MGEVLSELLRLTRGAELVGERSDVARSTWSDRELDSATLEAAASRALDTDRERLRELLVDLFENVADRGGAGVAARVGTLDDRDGFHVEDGGEGIPADERDDVVERSHTTIGDGTDHVPRRPPCRHA